jgi:hypothetical protein
LFPKALPTAKVGTPLAETQVEHKLPQRINV